MTKEAALPVPPDLAGCVALVTGASRGIGRAAAGALARAGAQVIATGTNQGALEELDDEVRAATGAGVTLVPLDLKDGDGLDRLGAALYERWGRLDALVAAAGVLGPMSPLGHVEPKDWTRTLAVNLTANWRLIRSVDPLLRASDAGRAVFLTSGVAAEPRAFWGPYAVSKAGLEALVRTYADEVANTAVRVALYNPGRTRTRMRAEAFPGEDPETLPPPEAHAPAILELLRADRDPPGGVVPPSPRA
ncbi:MAG: SDR family NAD(P)-dependent oxidoreductase [Proteobacteria bacterium]|nr:SDR family NAD(P)-dependent oxidoreductase [Pseudomonadota bacterium]